MKKTQVRQQQIPMQSVYPIKVNADYSFIRTDFLFLFFSHIAYSMFYLVLGIGFFRILGNHHVYGKENLRLLKRKGFISVANHCHIFDTVLTGVAFLPRRPWFASVQRNFEAPYYRKMFRILRGFPIPDGVFGLRKIMKPVITAIEQGKIIHMFPEEELWHLCQDIDYFQKGAFFLAHYAHCPVVPMVHLFKARTFFGKTLSKEILSIKTIIGEPIYPRKPVEAGKGADHESIQEMSDQIQNWMKSTLDNYHQRN